MNRDSWGMILLVAIVGVCLYIWYTTSDFALALVLMTAAFGIVWALDRLLFQRRRVERAVAEGNRPQEPMLVDYARSFFPVILAVLLFRTFLIEPFRIPSGSMMPTLLVGDFVLVNKFAYGLRLPVTDTKIVDIGEPKRGDIVVFKYPPNPKEDYIKRIIGLPGDTISVHDEQVFVNGQPAPQTFIGPDKDTDPESVKTAQADGKVYNEKLGKVSHHIIVLPPYMRAPQTEGSWTVPQGYYFAMGDNRDNSSDSRFWGPVPESDLRGKAFLIWFSLADLKRVGTILH
ncbi:MAG TPA: signal peptidase I [Rhodanobacteraceae bacterium]|nr:signal peptidase I [Rhodanobacteraceae bacterium]